MSKNLQFPTLQEMKNIESFVKRKENKNVENLKRDSLNWIRTSWQNKMDYEVNWLWVPIIQNPYDMILMQELIFKIQPDVIIETWVAHGGSLIYYSSLMELIWKGRIIWIDIEIRKHNKDYIEKHPMIKRVELIEWSSVWEDVIEKVKTKIKPTDIVMVLLDSDHRKPHVLNELNAYKDMVSVWSYMVVFDTFMPYLVWLEWAETSNYEDFSNNSAMHAVDEFIKDSKNYIIDENYNKFFISSCPNWFLKRINI